MHKMIELAKELPDQNAAKTDEELAKKLAATVSKVVAYVTRYSPFIVLCRVRRRKRTVKLFINLTAQTLICIYNNLEVP